MSLQCIKLTWKANVFSIAYKAYIFLTILLISCFVTVYGAPESSEMSKKPQKLKDSLIGMLHILPSFYFIYIPSNLWVIFTKHTCPWIIRTSSLNYDTSINLVEIKIVNPDDPNIKPLQKKLPGIYITEKQWQCYNQFHNIIASIHCTFFVEIYHVCMDIEFFDEFHMFLWIFMNAYIMF